MNLPAALSRAATLALILEYRGAEGDAKDALEDQLVRGNLRFCAFHARKYVRPGLELDDLMAVASAALLTAIRNFDPATSPHFAGYARRCIRRDLSVVIRRQHGPVRLPRLPRPGEAARGRRSTEAPTAVRLDVLSSDAADRVVGPDADDPFSAIADAFDAEQLNRLVDLLPDRQAAVVRLRYGLAGCAPHELREIGAVLSVSKQRVAAILDEAHAALRAQLTPHREAA